MTLDDLKKVFQDGYRTKCAAIIAAYGAYDEDECDSAGIAAVVRALRDKFHSSYANAWLGLTVDDLDSDFNEILGSEAGNEKAAGGPTPDNGRPLVEGADKETSQPAAPAADPKVCVWTPHHRTEVGVKMKSACGIISWRDFVNCPSCGKPIKFQEQP